MTKARLGPVGLLFMFAMTACGGSEKAACSNPCTTVGATQCNGSQVQTCAADVNGCLTFGAPASCASGQFCDNAINKCATCSSTCTPGATQCSSDKVQTCSTNSVGCPAFSAPTACPAGQACGGPSSKCVDVCTLPAVQTACASAALNFNQSCGGTAPATTGDALCHSIVTGGGDPQTQCSALGSASASRLHDIFQAQSKCCCPNGNSCDYLTSGWTCVPTCTTTADCGSVSGRTACAPSFASFQSGGQYVYGRYICVPDDGAVGHGCNRTNCAGGNNNICASDSHANLFCTQPCTADPSCGDPGKACCNVAKGSTPACGLCGSP